MIKFSVLMSTYVLDSPRNLHKSIKSLSNQTVLPSEIVLVLDGPLKRESHEVISHWKRLLENTLQIIPLNFNVGLAGALNIGLQKCQYEWVARMDADDECLPDRFAKQIAFIEENPDIVLLGGQSEECEKCEEYLLTQVHIRKVPLSHNEIIQFAKKRNPFNHMTVMFSKKAVLNEGGYPENLRKCQDYTLWAKLLARGYLTANLPEILVRVNAGKTFSMRRNGINYLKYELRALKQIREIGFFTRKEFIYNMVIRFPLRLLPNNIISLIYKRILRDRK